MTLLERAVWCRILTAHKEKKSLFNTQIGSGFIEKGYVIHSTYQLWALHFWLPPYEVWPCLLTLQCREMTEDPNLVSISHLLMTRLLKELVFFDCVTTSSHICCLRDGKKPVKHGKVGNVTLSPFNASPSMMKGLKRNVQKGILLSGENANNH